MNRHEVIDKLAAHRAEIQAMGIESLALFGSVARDEATDVSDVDLLVEFNRSVGIFHFARVRLRLSEILCCAVDLVTANALPEEMREDILREAERDRHLFLAKGGRREKRCQSLSRATAPQTCATNVRMGRMETAGWT